MGNVSKLVIKACSDNKFSSFIGEFITSINPENLSIKSGVAYHVAHGMVGAGTLKYRASPPRLLSFSLLFDNTGIIPGSNAISITEQIKQLQDVAYHIHKKNNSPNYIRIIWGELDFKGRLVKLDVSYTMFHVDGTLVGAEADIAVLEEIVFSGKGKNAAGVDDEYAKLPGATAKSNYSKQKREVVREEAFAATPGGMQGAYSGAPKGAYEGGPDDIYHGPSAVDNGKQDAGKYGEDSIGRDGAGSDKQDSNRKQEPITKKEPENTESAAIAAGGVAGHGPGGSGGGVGGGSHEPGSKANIAGSAREGKQASNKGSQQQSKSASSNQSTKSNPPTKSNKPSLSGITSSQVNSLRTLSTLTDMATKMGVGGLAVSLALQKLKEKFNFWERLKMLAKTVVPKAYNATKDLGSKAYSVAKETSKVATEASNKAYNVAKEASKVATEASKKAHDVATEASKKVHDVATEASKKVHDVATEAGKKVTDRIDHINPPL